MNSLYFRVFKKLPFCQTDLQVSNDTTITQTKKCNLRKQTQYSSNRSIKKYLLMGITKISGDIFGKTIAIVGAI